MFYFVTFRSVPFRWIRSVSFRSVPFRFVTIPISIRSVPFRSVPFQSVPFHFIMAVILAFWNGTERNGMERKESDSAGLCTGGVDSC